MDIEQRIRPRKPVRVNALVSVSGIPSMTVRTIDISEGGICLSMPRPLTVGQKCNLAFELVKNGKKGRVMALAKVIYCILNSQDGFKTGLQFIEIDPTSAGVISQFIRA